MLTLSQIGIQLKGPIYCWKLISEVLIILFSNGGYVVEILVLGELRTRA